MLGVVFLVVVMLAGIGCGFFFIILAGIGYGSGDCQVRLPFR